MGGDILALFGVVLAAAVAELLIPSQEGGTRQAMHLLTALVVLILLLRPFLSFLGSAEELWQGDISWTESGQDTEDFENILADAVAKRSAEELKKGLYVLLLEEYDVAAQDCEIRVALNDTGELVSISVFLSGKALARDPEVIERDLYERFACVVEVR